jgi:hypothetical protein
VLHIVASGTGNNVGAIAQRLEVPPHPVQVDCDPGEIRELEVAWIPEANKHDGRHLYLHWQYRQRGPVLTASQ